MIQPFDPKDFRGALGSFVTGVTIVTTRCDEDGDVGVTANSFNSVSLDPPMVLWSLALNARSRPAFERSDHFAVHVLATDQQDLSNRFARSGTDKFAGLELSRGTGEVPLLPGCAACFQCRTAYRYEGGDHIIFVGEVVEFEHFHRTPLAFHSGQYAVAAAKAEPLSAKPADFNVAADGSFGEDFVGYLLGRSYFQLFGKLAHDREQLGISIREYFVISLLAIRNDLSLDELVAMLDYTGYPVDAELVQGLVDRELVALSGPLVQDGHASLTDAGRQVALKLIAVAKAAEADAMGHFSSDEQHVLKNLLKRLIRATDPGVPDIWTDS